MTEEALDPDLTQRQQAILRALLLRTPIKQIAFDHAIAPSTVNDHIKAIKRKIGVHTTAQLVAHFLQTGTIGSTPANEGETNWRMSGSKLPGDARLRGHTDALSLSDSMTFSLDAPWAGGREPRVVPEELDGPGATLPRLVAIGKAVALILAVVVLSIMALETVDGLMVSEVASDR